MTTAVVVLLLAGLLVSDAPAELKRLASGLGLVMVGLNAALACRGRARRSSDRPRRSWTLWSLACLSGAASNVALLLNGARAVHRGVAPSDVALLVTLSLSAAGLVCFPRTRRRGTDLARMLLDGVVIGGSILAVVSMQVGTALDGMNVTNYVVNLVTPVLDVVVATLAILLFTRSAPADRPILGAGALCFILFGVSDLLYTLTLLEEGRFALGSPVDLGWLAGYALLAWGIRHPRGFTGSVDVSAAEISPVRGTATVFLVFLGASLFGAVVLHDASLTAVALVIWVMVLLAVLGRQFFLVLDNEQLRRTLEQRVVERTRSLRQVTRRSDLVVSSVGDGIYGVDRFGLITFVNPAAAGVLGYEAVELIGHDAYRTFHSPAAVDVAYLGENSYLAEAIENGVMTSGQEDTYLRADGREIPVEVTATPLSDDGTRLGAVVVFRDVTQRREVDRLKNEFVSMVSHELRTPLTAIRGSLGLLAGGALGPLTATAARMVDIALVSSDRLTRLINEILDLERMEAGGLPLDLGSYSAEALIDTAMGQATVLAHEAGVAVRVAHVEGEVRADADRVVQTLLNLLGNAIKFSEPGQEVTVRSTQRGKVVEFEVADAGRGIPEDKLESVFARFQQVDSSDAREKGGSGLGLAISRSLVERLGGRIWAENNPNGGAVFRFTLPTATSVEPVPVQPPDQTRALDRGPDTYVDEDDLRPAPAESAH
ncbi:sensor histidine kinase [uncultured Friedmanniella sp.]|uniref:sensor histidine kinase n=1 Tax=uncultured Friedmanniella sp. TaxID=335381 RepID=UPI0035CA5F52